MIHTCSWMINNGYYHGGYVLECFNCEPFADNWGVHVYSIVLLIRASKFRQSQTMVHSGLLCHGRREKSTATFRLVVEPRAKQRDFHLSVGQRWIQLDSPQPYVWGPKNSAWGVPPMKSDQHDHDDHDAHDDDDPMISQWSTAMVHDHNCLCTWTVHVCASYLISLHSLAIIPQNHQPKTDISKCP